MSQMHVARCQGGAGVTITLSIDWWTRTLQKYRLVGPLWPFSPSNTESTVFAFSLWSRAVVFFHSVLDPSKASLCLLSSSWVPWAGSLCWPPLNRQLIVHIWDHSSLPSAQNSIWPGLWRQCGTKCVYVGKYFFLLLAGKHFCNFQQRNIIQTLWVFFSPEGEILWPGIKHMKSICLISSDTNVSL